MRAAWLILVIFLLPVSAAGPAIYAPAGLAVVPTEEGAEVWTNFCPVVTFGGPYTCQRSRLASAQTDEGVVEVAYCTPVEQDQSRPVCDGALARAGPDGVFLGIGVYGDPRLCLGHENGPCVGAVFDTSDGFACVNASSDVATVQRCTGDALLG